MNHYQARKNRLGLCLQKLPARTETFITGIVLAVLIAVSAGIAQAQAINEGFDDVSTLPGKGWVQINRSNPPGPGIWSQGNPAVFPAQSGAATDSYTAVTFQSSEGSGTISNWLITPQVTLNNGDVFTFYTRKVDGEVDFPDRLELRLSTNGASTDVGTTATSVGDFTTLLLTINPTLAQNVYPTEWSQYTVTLSGLTTPATGRFAFRYFVTNGGTDASNSDYIGVDSVTFPFAPTAAPVYISGRVLTAGGSAVSGAVVTLTGADGTVKSVRTNAFGYYRIDDVEAMGTGVLTASAKRYSFDTQTVNLIDNLAEQNFIAR